MKLTVAEIARIVEGELIGPGDAVITSIAPLNTAGPGQATFARHEHLKTAAESPASVILVQEKITAKAALIIVKNPYFAFGRLLTMAEAEQRSHPKGIHPTAVIGEGTKLGKNAGIGAHAVIGEGCIIGDNAVIYPNTTIGARCVIGDHSVIYANVAVREECAIGKRSIVHSNTTIGGDGFGYVQAEGRHIKVPQVGIVEVGDDVEIGCNCTIDRATMDKTVIENGVKIDNHSHIAHNCRIGANSMLIAYARMGGSTLVGKNVLLAEDVGLTNGIQIGDRTIIGAASKVTRSWPADSLILGAPAQRMEDEKRQLVFVKRLPKMYEMLKKLQADVERLSETTKDTKRTKNG